MKVSELKTLIKKNVPLAVILALAVAAFIVGLTRDKGPYKELSVFLDSLAGSGNWRIQANHYDPETKLLTLTGLNIKINRNLSLTADRLEVSFLLIQDGKAQADSLKAFGLSAALDQKAAGLKLEAASFEMTQVNLSPKPIALTALKIASHNLSLEAFWHLASAQASSEPLGDRAQGSSTQTPDNSPDALSQEAFNAQIELVFGGLFLEGSLNLGAGFAQSTLSSAQADKLRLKCLTDQKVIELKFDGLNLTSLEKLKTAEIIRGSGFSFSFTPGAKGSFIPPIEAKAASVEANKFNFGDPLADPSPTQILTDPSPELSRPLGYAGSAIAAIINRSWSLPEISFSDLKIDVKELFSLDVSKASLLDLSNEHLSLQLKDFVLKNPILADSSEDDGQISVLKMFQNEQISGQFSAALDLSPQLGELNITIDPINLDNLLSARSNLKAVGLTVPWLMGQSAVGLGLNDGPALTGFELYLKDLSATEQLLAARYGSFDDPARSKDLFADSLEMGLTIRFDNLLENTKEIAESLRGFLKDPQSLSLSFTPERPIYPRRLETSQDTFELVKELSLSLSVNGNPPVFPKWRASSLGFDRDYTTDDSGLYPKNGKPAGDD